jgi:hypothetical protein
MIGLERLKWLAISKKTLVQMLKSMPGLQESTNNDISLRGRFNIYLSPTHRPSLSHQVIPHISSFLTRELACDFCRLQHRCTVSWGALQGLRKRIQISESTGTILERIGMGNRPGC